MENLVEFEICLSILWRWNRYLSENNFFFKNVDPHRVMWKPFHQASHDPVIADKIIDSICCLLEQAHIVCLLIKRLISFEKQQAFISLSQSLWIAEYFYYRPCSFWLEENFHPRDFKVVCCLYRLCLIVKEVTIPLEWKIYPSFLLSLSPLF